MGTRLRIERATPTVGTVRPARALTVAATVAQVSAETANFPHSGRFDEKFPCQLFVDTMQSESDAGGGMDGTTSAQAGAPGASNGPAAGQACCSCPSSAGQGAGAGAGQAY